MIRRIDVIRLMSYHMSAKEAQQLLDLSIDTLMSVDFSPEKIRALCDQLVTKNERWRNIR
jgi:hypothetical protein